MPKSIPGMGSKKSDLLRNQEHPTVLGYELNRQTLTPLRNFINTSKKGDYGADPVGNGKFKMVPSGDIVDYAERCKRLGQAQDELQPVPVKDEMANPPFTINYVLRGQWVGEEPFVGSEAEGKHMVRWLSTQSPYEVSKKAKLKTDDFDTVYLESSSGQIKFSVKRVGEGRFKKVAKGGNVSRVSDEELKPVPVEDAGNKFQIGQTVKVSSTNIVGKITHVQGPMDGDPARYKVEGRYWNEPSITPVGKESAKDTRSPQWQPDSPDKPLLNDLHKSLETLGHMYKYSGSGPDKGSIKHTYSDGANLMERKNGKHGIGFTKDSKAAKDGISVPSGYKLIQTLTNSKGRVIALVGEEIAGKYPDDAFSMTTDNGQWYGTKPDLDKRIQRMKELSYKSLKDELKPVPVNDEDKSGAQKALRRWQREEEAKMKAGEKERQARNAETLRKMREGKDTEPVWMCSECKTGFPNKRTLETHQEKTGHWRTPTGNPIVPEGAQWSGWKAVGKDEANRPAKFAKGDTVAVTGITRVGSHSGVVTKVIPVSSLAGGGFEYQVEFDDDLGPRTRTVYENQMTKGSARDSTPEGLLSTAQDQEIAQDRKHALDSYRKAAAAFRSVGDSKQEAVAREGIDECQRKLVGGVDSTYQHPSSGKVQAFDSADRALTSAIQRTRAGERVRAARDSKTGETVVEPVKDGSPWEDNVVELAGRIKKAVKEQRADGIVSMSKGNLKQLISSRGLSFPNANAFERGFEEALGRAGVGKFIHA